MELKNLLKEQKQAMVYSGQSIAEVLQNNPHSWILESCDLEFPGWAPGWDLGWAPGWDLGGQQTANVKIRFFDPQVAGLFINACRNGIYNYTSPSIMEDKVPDLGQHYVKDFGDD